MIEIIQSPSANGLYGLQDVPSIEFYCDGMAAVVVDMEGNGSFSGSYVPDSGKLVEIDIRDILSGMTSSKFRLNTVVTNQSDFTHAVSVEIKDDNNTKTINFKVANIHCKVTGQLSQLFNERFLTTQPSVKYITAKSKEYLTLTNTFASAKLMAKFYSNSGGETIKLLDLQQRTITCNVSPELLFQQSNIPSSNRKPYYDVYFVIPDGGTYKTLFSQRYVIKDATDAEKYYIFENELGGFDTIICKGLLVTTPSITYNTAKLSSGVIQLDDTDDHFAYEQKSGYFPATYKDWIKSFLKSKRQKYVYDASSNSVKKIIWVDSGYEVNDRDGMICFSFSYIYADGDENVLSAGKPSSGTGQIVTSRIDGSMGDGAPSRRVQISNTRGGVSYSDKIECTSEKMNIQVCTEGELRIYTSTDGDTWTLFDSVFVEESTVRPYETLTIGSFLKVESDGEITFLNIIAV